MAFMITCKGAVDTMASSRPLSLYGKIQLRFHLLICGPCAAFLEQLRILKAAIRKFLAGQPSLSDEECKKLEDSIIARLKEKGAGDEGK